MKNITFYLLISTIMGIALFCKVPEILEKPPMSIHIWRQADCLSLTKNYSENLNFFEPSIHNYISEDITSGKTVGEFPIVYYFVGAVWKYFGESIFFYRLLGIIIFALGIIYLFKTTILITENKFWSYFISITIFSSPVLFYYSLSFLTNVYALSFVLIGWYYLVLYLKNNKAFDFAFFTFLFLLAGLLKVTALLSFIAFIGGVVINCIINKRIKKSDLMIFGSFLFTIGFIALWFYWAESYNNKYGGKYTFNSVWPIWKMKEIQIEKAVTFGKEFIYNQMFNRFTWSIIWLICLFILANLRKKIALISSLIFLIIGVVIYSALWFNAFDGHDYYVINLTILPISIFVIGAYLAKKLNPNLLNNKSIKTIGVFLLIYNALFIATNMRTRFHDKLFGEDFTKNYFMDSYEIDKWKGMKWVSMHYEGLDLMEEYNRSIGIKKEDLIIFIPDGTFNASLFLLNQKGWTSFGGNHTTSEEGIKHKIEKNAKYLILGKKEFKNKPYLKSFINNKIGEFRGKGVYKLQ